MQIEIDNTPQLVRYIANNQNHQLQCKFLDFLGLEVLIIIADKFVQLKKNIYFMRLLITKIYINQYLNRVDRSSYFFFYEDQEFNRIQKNNILRITKNYSEQFVELYRQVKFITQKIKEQAQVFELQEELIDIVEEIFFEPQLPLPKLKRENVGIYCQTSFQQFVAMLRFPAKIEEQYLDPPLSKMKDDLQSTHESQLNPILFSENDIKKIMMVRYCGNSIGIDNLEHQFICKFPLHNLISCFFALANVIQKSSNSIIEHQQDPLMKLVQFCMRSNVFRSIVLIIQEKIGFLFRLYQSTLVDICPKMNNEPQFNFWLPAITIWKKNMNHFHHNLLPTLHYILAKQREQTIIHYIEEKCEKFPSIYTLLKNELDAHNFCMMKREICYSGQDNKNEVQTFFENNKQLYTTIGKDYLEYMVDICINEFTVHRCGHSQHRIKQMKDFKTFTQDIISQSMQFYSSLQQVIQKRCPQELNLTILRDVVKQDLDLLETNFLKPVITSQLLAEYNGWIKQLIKQVPEYQVFDEEGYQKFSITIDNNPQDNLLDYFADKCSIQFDCEPSKKWLYNTGQLLSLQEVLDIVQIKESDDSESFGEDYQKYLSEDDENEGHSL